MGCEGNKRSAGHTYPNIKSGGAKSVILRRPIVCLFYLGVWNTVRATVMVWDGVTVRAKVGTSQIFVGERENEHPCPSIFQGITKKRCRSGSPFFPLPNPQERIARSGAIIPKPTSPVEIGQPRGGTRIFSPVLFIIFCCTVFHVNAMLCYGHQLVGI